MTHLAILDLLIDGRQRAQPERRRPGTIRLAMCAVGLSSFCAYMVWSFRRAIAEESANSFAFGYAFPLVVIPVLVVAGVLALESGLRMRRVSHRVLMAAAVAIPVPPACFIPVWVPGPRNPPNVFLVLGAIYYSAAAIVVVLALKRYRWRGLLRIAAALPVAAALLYLVQSEQALVLFVFGPIVEFPAAIWRAVTGSQ